MYAYQMLDISKEEFTIHKTKLAFGVAINLKLFESKREKILYGMNILKYKPSVPK